MAAGVGGGGMMPPHPEHPTGLRGAAPVQTLTLGCCLHHPVGLAVGRTTRDAHVECGSLQVVPRDAPGAQAWDRSPGRDSHARGP